MASPHRVTMRDIARRVGVSHTTVSLALRNDPRILRATRQKVQEAAATLGYQHDAVLSSLMGRLRSIRVRQERSTLGFVTAWPGRYTWRNAPNIRRFHGGVQARSQQLGYKLDEFWLAAPGMTPSRMTEILTARGIKGLVLPSLPPTGGHISLDWQRFACVTKGLTIMDPPLHRVVSSHYEDMQLVLEKLSSLGYQRIGLVLSEVLSHRVNRAWAAAYFVHQNEIPLHRRLPPLILPDSDLQKGFNDWFKTAHPDALLFSDQPVPRWVSALDLRVPDDIGLVNLDWSPDFAPFAGIDSDSEALGAAAVDLLVGQLEANEFGVPRHEKIITIKGRWVTGTTVRTKR